jgi:RNA polymerase sigma-70 factor, ECF subfamily
MAAERDDAAQWLAAARAGSTEALGQALDACRGYLLLIAQQELDPDLRAKGGASDLVQATFLKAQRRFDAFHGDTAAELRAWLRQVLLNTLADFRRQYRATGKRRVGREVHLAGDAAGPDGASLVADLLSPSRQAMHREQAEAVQQALGRLPQEYRRVLLLRYDEGRSFEEIGPLMQRTANAARKLWLRAVERLQQELDAPS